MAKAFAFIAFLLLCAYPAQGHSAEAGKKEADASPYVSKIHFSGNKAISEEELRLIISTSEQRSFLGLGLFGGSAKPFNSEEFDKDIFLIKKLYTYKGYFFAGVDTTIIQKKGGKKLTLNINIHENEPSRVDFVTYEGLEKISDELKKEYLAKKRLNVNMIFFPLTDSLRRGIAPSRFSKSMALPFFIKTVSASKLILSALVQASSFNLNCRNNCNMDRSML